VTAEDGWLPPDNYQEAASVSPIARRVADQHGDALLSSVAAHDLGYLTTRALIERLDQTLATLESLERHHGHLFNWYDTSTRTAAAACVDRRQRQSRGRPHDGDAGAEALAATPQTGNSGSTASRIRVMCSRH
jgi:hypothetical protein